MKLKEFVEDIYKTFDLSPGTDIITSDKLKFFLQILRQIDEFSGCVLNIWDGSYHLEEKLWQDSGDNIGGKFEIHSISLSPMMYNTLPHDYMVKDDCGISPLFYNTNSCSPYKEIRMRVDVTKHKFDYLAKEYLHRQLDNILNNPEEYTIKGNRRVLIRGNFKDVIYLKQ